MPDLDLAELDRLHAEAVQADADLETVDLEDSKAFLSITRRHCHFQEAMVKQWPSLRARIAELERKAAAWDAVKGNIHEAASGTGKFEGYECDAWWHEEHPTTKAISAAVAAKESKHD